MLAGWVGPGIVLGYLLKFQKRSQHRWLRFPNQTAWQKDAMRSVVSLGAGLRTHIQLLAVADQQSQLATVPKCRRPTTAVRRAQRLETCCNSMINSFPGGNKRHGRHGTDRALNIPRQPHGHTCSGTHPKRCESSCDHQPQILQSINVTTALPVSMWMRFAIVPTCTQRVSAYLTQPNDHN